MADGTPLQIPDSFEDILKNEEKIKEKEQISLEDKFAKERLEWS